MGEARGRQHLEPDRLCNVKDSRVAAEDLFGVTAVKGDESDSGMLGKEGCKVVGHDGRALNLRIKTFGAGSLAASIP